MAKTIKTWIAERWHRTRSGVDRTVIYNAMYGRFYVMYPDGKCSLNMCWDTAQNYQQIFGGQIVFVRIK